MQSLYIHIPFCESKCLFCSFVISVGQDKRIDEYLECLESEASRYKGSNLKTIYVGGGTPTYLNEQQLVQLRRIIEDNFNFKSDIEITIEANPESISKSKGQLLNDLGFNRISLGVQSLNDKYLTKLGRCHDHQKAVEAYENLRSSGTKNINLDLMFSFPDQTEEELLYDIEGICSLESDHLSIYSLTVEKNSKYYAQNLELKDGQTQASFYSLIIKELQKRGFKQYEISNFARNGHFSKHNIMYWQGGDYIGLGVGAHSHFEGRRWWNVSRLLDYMKKAKAGDSLQEDSETLSTTERLMESILFGLRMNKGVNVSSQERRFNCELENEKKTLISDMIRNEYLYREEDYLKTSDKGRLVLDELCSRLI